MKIYNLNLVVNEFLLYNIDRFSVVVMPNLKQTLFVTVRIKILYNAFSFHWL
jgi:hypothetical protein